MLQFAAEGDGRSGAPGLEAGAAIRRYTVATIRDAGDASGQAAVSPPGDLRTAAVGLDGSQGGNAGQDERTAGGRSVPGGAVAAPLTAANRPPAQQQQTRHYINCLSKTVHKAVLRKQPAFQSLHLEMTAWHLNNPLATLIWLSLTECRLVLKGLGVFRLNL